MRARLKLFSTNCVSLILKGPMDVHYAMLVIFTICLIALTALGPNWNGGHHREDVNGLLDLLYDL